MESLKQVGFHADALEDARPKLCDAASEAIQVWNLMGGWYPERLQVLLSFLELEHIDGLFERLLVIRRSIRESEDGRPEDHANGG